MSSPFLDVLSESFDTPSGVSETAARPFALIEFCHAVQRSRSSLQDHDFSTEAAEFALATLGRLTTLCASYDGVGFEQAAAEMYRRPATFRRDAALALALDREPEGAQAIVEMAAYVDRAEVGEPTSPVPLHELLIDRRLVWERLSAALAFKAPHQIEELAGNFAVFRRRFVDAYVAHHQAYQAFSETARQGLDQDATAVRALGRLNSLERLGPPRGEDLRRRLDTVEEQLVVCAEDDAVLRTHLSEAPQCASCELTLSDATPEAELESIRAELQAALREKQRRLATVMAARAASAPANTPLQRFLDAAQAADVGPLIEAIGDQAVELIADLLEES